MAQKIETGSLVLYKSRPARVTAVTDKIDIELESGSKRVRDKDILLLHPGPVADLGDLLAPEPELDEVLELIAGETLTLIELAELLFGDYTPVSAWTTWQLVLDGLYFEGTPEAIQARPQEEIAAEQAARREKRQQAEAWDGMIARLKSGVMEEQDRNQLSEVERLAVGQISSSRILQALDISESSEHAHRLLVRVGYWDADYNPYPRRFGVTLDEPLLEVPPLPDEERLDLTQLDAWAIDDEGSEDPDDAISIDGDYLWVHVADAAALVTPDSELDKEARGRSANLYLPDQMIPTLPHTVTHQLGLGLNEQSPALSIGFRLDDSGLPVDIRVELSRIHAQRMSYDQATEQLDTTFPAIDRLAQRYQRRRKANGAASIDLPEVNIRVRDDDIRITPYGRGGSRQMVTEAMLAAGEAAAIYAGANGIAVPYAFQPPPEEIQHPETMAGMYAYRRFFKPSRAAVEPASHFGLGLERYTRATSPLRRYLDLVTHQQLRAHLKGETPLDQEQVLERIGAAEAMSGTIRRTERFSNQHWKLIFLKRNKRWQGDAVVVDLSERKAMLIIPGLALETRVRRHPEMELDAVVRVEVQEIDLADQDLRLKII